MLEYENLETLEVTGRYLVSLIAAVLNENEIPALPLGITWENVYNMATNHGVEAIAFCGAKKYLSRESSLYGKWRNRKDQDLIQSVIQLGERDEIFRSLYEAGIRFLPLKGCEMKELYTQIEFRQMSDLDILVDVDNAEIVRGVMEKLGYKTHAFGRKHDDDYYKYPYMHVEIHRQMLPDNVEKHVYYNNIWEKVVPNVRFAGGWKLSFEDFYIYQLVHFEKHFNEMGSGIRFLMDIYVYLQAYGNLMNWEYIRNELNVLNLTEFYEKMEYLSIKWFSPNNEKNISQFCEKKMMELEKNIFLAGLYGSREFIKARDMEKNKIEKNIYRCLVYIFRRIFMSKEEFGYAYPITKTYPLLIPFFWFYRIYDVLFHKRLFIIKELELFFSKRN